VAVRRRVKPIDNVVIDKLSTKRLLAYRDRLLTLEESPELSDLESDEISSLDSTYIWFKSDPRWREIYDQVINTLGRRENIP
jgi:hypothetical protein